MGAFPSGVHMLKKILTSVKEFLCLITDEKKIIQYQNGTLEISYFKKGKLHRDDGKPALVAYNPSGDLIFEEYYKDGVLHRENDKPAALIYVEPGIIRSEKYYKFGLLHRDGDKPAVIIRSLKTGSIIIEYFYKNGRIHRGYQGPAKIVYNEITRNIENQGFYEHGSPLENSLLRINRKNFGSLYGTKSALLHNSLG